jgi:BMFP domain-containing protein YqiC
MRRAVEFDLAAAYRYASRGPPPFSREEREAVMQSENRLLDDLARVATGALGALTGVRDELETRLRDQFERVLGRMNLVRREEFDAVQAMAAKARAEQEALAARVAALEARLGIGSPAEPHATPRRPLRSRPAMRKPKPAEPL